MTDLKTTRNTKKQNINVIYSRRALFRIINLAVTVALVIIAVTHPRSTMTLLQRLQWKRWQSSIGMPCP